MGVVMAGQPPHSLQSRLGGRERQALGPEPQALGVERHDVDRLRRSRHRAECQARRGRSLHHEQRKAPGGCLRARLCAKDRSRCITSRSSRRLPIRSTRRSEAIRWRACSKTTWSNLATPRSSPTRRPPTGSPNTSTTGPSTARSMLSLQPEFFVEISEELAKEKGIKRRLGARLVEARLGESQGVCDQADQATDLRRQDRPCRRHPAALGLHGRGPQGLWAEFADALCRRRQCRDAGIQGVPGRYRAHRSGPVA